MNNIAFIYSIKNTAQVAVDTTLQNFKQVENSSIYVITNDDSKKSILMDGYPDIKIYNDKYECMSNITEEIVIHVNTPFVSFITEWKNIINQFFEGMQCQIVGQEGYYLSPNLHDNKWAKAFVSDFCDIIMPTVWAHINIGYYDEFETDFELLLNLRKLGLKFRRIPEIFIYSNIDSDSDFLKIIKNYNREELFLENENIKLIIVKYNKGCDANQTWSIIKPILLYLKENYPKTKIGVITNVDIRNRFKRIVIETDNELELQKNPLEDTEVLLERTYDSSFINTLIDLDNIEEEIYYNDLLDIKKQYTLSCIAQNYVPNIKLLNEFDKQLENR